MPDAANPILPRVQTMLLPLPTARIPELIGDLISRCCRWSPIDAPVTVGIEFSDDPYLAGRELDGTIRAYDEQSGTFVIVLSRLLTRYDRSVDLVVAAPVLRWHGAGRLLLLWSAVRLVDAASVRDLSAGDVLGTGRLRLR
jgi:hypothetical protein